MDINAPQVALTIYERRALDEIIAWRHPSQSAFEKLLDPLTSRVGDAADWAAGTKVGTVATKAVAGAIGAVNDVTSWSVRPESILSEYRSDEHPSVSTLTDINKLSLEQAEKTIGYLSAKYKLVALTEGGATGSLGLPGIAIDVPALLSIALRAVGEYATYYGYDVSQEAERYVILTILGSASSTDVAAKQVAMSEVTKAFTLAGKKKTWDELNKIGLITMIRKIAEQLGIRLTKAKLAQLLPILGALVGAGFNAWYISSVCFNARMAYRERFLRDKYGESVVPHFD